MSRRRIAILLDHNPQMVVGWLDGTLARFVPRTVTESNMLPGGWRTIRDEWVDGVRYLLEIELVELSISAASERPVVAAPLSLARPRTCERCGHPSHWHRYDDSQPHEVGDPSTWVFRCLGYDCDAAGAPPAENPCGCLAFLGLQEGP